jgi:hypothetical protein
MGVFLCLGQIGNTLSDKCLRETIVNLKEVFSSFIGKDEIIAVFCEPNDDYSNVYGFANQIDDNYFVSNEISTRGKYDGYMLRKTEDIFRIDCGSYYEVSLRKVAKSLNIKHREIPVGNNVFMNYIRFAKDSKLVVGVCVNEYGRYDITGYIEGIDEEAETLTIQIISHNKEGAFDGFTIVAFDEVLRMCCDSEGDRFLQTLNEIAEGK